MLDQLISSNIDALNEGQELLHQLGEERYTQSCKPAFASTIGAHFRHIIEHYLCLFNQLEGGQICYDKRLRDPSLEQDYNKAMSALNSLSEQLESLSEEQTLQVADMQTEFLVPSSLQRELLFLQSHTTHHYAMIAAMSRLLGMTPDADFGVAIATRAAVKDQIVRTLDNEQETPLCAQ